MPFTIGYDGDALPPGDQFAAHYDEHADRDGQRFEFVALVHEPDDEHDAEVLPMYRIRFDDGTEIEAWPEEVGYPHTCDRQHGDRDDLHALFAVTAEYKRRTDEGAT